MGSLGGGGLCFGLFRAVYSAQVPKNRFSRVINSKIADKLPLLNSGVLGLKLPILTYYLLL